MHLMNAYCLGKISTHLRHQYSNNVPFVAGNITDIQREEPGRSLLSVILFSSSLQLAQRQSVRARRGKRGKEEDDVPRAALLHRPPLPPCDGHSPVFRAPRKEGVRPGPPSQRCHGNRVLRPAGAQALHHPVSGPSPLQHIQNNVLAGLPPGEQTSIELTFLPRLLPRLAEISLTQLQPRKWRLEAACHQRSSSVELLLRMKHIEFLVRATACIKLYKALCAQPCVNGGTCLKPNKCGCPPGWTGHQCQTDVDECGGRQPCAQLCMNTAGSYRCACRDGFRLAGDGRSCHQLPSPPTPTQSSQAAVGGHADAGK
ncbi:hypothetical protein XENOCAPTIV_023867 [Xenoophorus captivus]|uniref:EGF-like domain-containing protein n=1 Tax=Xenoophorus captivus TaxID=1517983 RepID=A0ABV0QKP3_9TELE